MHWMDVLSEPGLNKTSVIDIGGAKSFAMQLVISNLAAPSWNRLLAMHHMERAKIRSLIHNIVCETISGRDVSCLAVIEYDALNRPGKAKKELLKTLRSEQVPEHRRLRRMLQNGYEREKITERPVEFDGPVAVVFKHFRYREIDNDNLSCKAVLDSLVQIGLIPDDSPQIVHTVTHQQFKIDKSHDETLCIEIMELPPGLLKEQERLF